MKERQQLGDPLYKKEMLKRIVDYSMQKHYDN